MAHRHGRRARPRVACDSGAAEFIGALQATGTPFLVLTNNSIYTRRDLAARLRLGGLDIPEDHIWTSADATARFLDDQRPHGSAFAIGEAGLTTALHEIGYTQTSATPTTSSSARPAPTASSASRRRSA